jgi:hypothetical protein
MGGASCNKVVGWSSYRTSIQRHQAATCKDNKIAMQADRGAANILCMQLSYLRQVLQAQITLLLPYFQCRLLSNQIGTKFLSWVVTICRMRPVLPSRQLRLPEPVLLRAAGQLHPLLPYLGAWLRPTGI